MTAEHPVTFLNVLQMIFNADLWSIVWLSLRISVVAVVLSALLGIPFGAWLGLSSKRLARVLRPFVITGMALPPVVVGLVLYLLLSRSGPLAFLGWLFTPEAMILAQVILCLPFVVGITASSVANVPVELYPQLQSLGASSWQARWIILREAKPGVLLAIAAALGRSLSEVGAVMMVGGNVKDQTRVMTTAIVLETSKGEFALALILGSILLTLAMAVNLAILRLNRSRAWP